MKTADGLQLHTHHWPAEGASHGPSHGTVVLSHGLGEHLGRYAHVAAFFNRLGWDVCGPDHRGHGLSEGPRGDIAEPDSLLQDLGQFIGTVAQANPERPVLLLGHSMGAMLAARYVAEGLSQHPQAWHHPVAGLVLSSPPIDMGLNLLQRALLAITPAVLPHLCVSNGLKPEWVCNVPEVVAAYLRDPLVHDRISGRLAQFMHRSGPEVLAVAPRWTTPTLLMWAGADRCLNPQGSERLARALPAHMATTRCFPGMGHEIFNEAEQGLVFDTLRGWLLRTVPA